MIENPQKWTQRLKNRLKESRYLWPYWAGCLAAWVLILIVAIFLLAGCSPILATGLKPDAMRTALDECDQNNLNVLLYQRPDGSVFALRCVPKEEEVYKVVTVRPRVPMRAIRPFLEKEFMVKIEDGD